MSEARIRAQGGRKQAATLLLLGAGLLALHAVASFLATNHLWGLDALGVFAPAARIVWIATSAVLLWAGWRSGFPEIRPPRGRAGLVTVAALCAAFAVLALSLREAAPLWGDGYLRLERIAEGKPANTFAGRAALESWLQGAAFRTLGPLFGRRPAPVSALWSVFMGVLFVPLGVWAARKAVARERLAAAVALLLTGATVELFFGHIESYATFAVGLITFLALGLSAFEGSVPRIVAGVSLVPLVFIHPAALALVPSSMLLLRAPAPTGRARTLERVLAAALAVFIAYQLVREAKEIFAAQSRGAPDLAARVGDSMNEWLLVHPAALALAAVVLAGTRLRKAFSDSRTSYLGVAAAGLFVLPFVLGTELGGLRDWDLFAALGIPLALFAARLLDGAPVADLWKRRLAGIACAIALAHVIPWIAMNASETRLVARFERLLDAPPALPAHAAGLAEGAFGDYLVSKHRSSDALPHYERAMSWSGRATYIQKLTALLRERGDVARADALSRELLAKAGSRPESHMSRGLVLVQERRYAEAADEFRSAVALDPNSAAAKVNLGAALVKAGQTESGRAVLAEAAREHPDFAAAFVALGYLDLHDGDLAKAEAGFRRALEADPQNREARAGLERIRRQAEEDSTH